MTDIRGWQQLLTLPTEATRTTTDEDGDDDWEFDGDDELVNGDVPVVPSSRSAAGSKLPNRGGSAPGEVDGGESCFRSLEFEPCASALGWQDEHFQQPRSMDFNQTGSSSSAAAKAGGDVGRRSRRAPAAAAGTRRSTETASPDDSDGDDAAEALKNVFLSAWTNAKNGKFDFKKGKIFLINVIKFL